MSQLDLPAATRLAEAAADRARGEILPRFRRVAVETKSDGSPVTEADRAAERAIREVLAAGDPGAAILGEEYGAEGDTGERHWLVDPIDGTIAFSRGIPLFSTIIALVEQGRTRVGLIDLPALGERTVAFEGGGCHRNGEPIRVSEDSDLQRTLVSHGDPLCFGRAGQQRAFQRMAAELPFLRGYTDAFGHALVASGGIGVMADLDMNPWDAAATEILIPEAGGKCVRIPDRRPDKIGLVFGAPALVDQLVGFFDGV